MIDDASDPAVLAIRRHRRHDKHAPDTVYTCDCGETFTSVAAAWCHSETHGPWDETPGGYVEWHESL